MSEHQHEWTVDHQIIPETSPTGIPIGECFAYCGCGAELRWNEVTYIINAHAGLMAKLEAMEQLLEECHKAINSVPDKFVFGVGGDGLTHWYLADELLARIAADQRPAEELR